MAKTCPRRKTILPLSLLMLIPSLVISHLSFADQPLTVTLVSEVTSIQPGQPFHAGLHLHHGRGYHSYWKYPGIVGVPTGIKWELPPGFTASEIEWPAPERVLMYKIKAQGYERDVVLPVEITPPANLKPGDTITLKGQSSWMSCAMSCHPGFTNVSLTLPVKAEPPVSDPKWKPIFDQERSRYAKPSSAWTAAAKEDEKTITLTLKPAADHARKIANHAEAQKLIFFTEDGWIDTDQPQLIELKPDGTIQFQLTKAELYLKDQPPAKLEGIVWNEKGWQSSGNLQSMTIRPKLER